MIFNCFDYFNYYYNYLYQYFILHFIQHYYDQYLIENQAFHLFQE